MRALNFRAWNKVVKQMGTPFTLKEAIDEFARISMPDENNEVIYMQYTGLKDKKGKEIYEGDIVHAIGDVDCREYEMVTPIICNVSGEWQVKTPDEHGVHYVHGLPVIWGGWESIEVIGNIYENPELIKEQIK
jgi:uncharacterized phage protein (TIGR01671 family)